jgi:hypothetical protein
VLRLVAYLWLGALGAIAADGSLRGVVRDARTGEPLARVAAQLAGESRQTLTGDDGSFDFGAVAAGEHVVNVATVGYRLSQTKTAVGDGERIELDVTLTPDVMARRDRVEVRSDAFDLTRDGGPTAFAIDGGEAKHLATVLADDPLRAAQSLPGVSSNDDFDSRFSVHGAPYSRVGLYLDGILLHMPFHTVQGEGPTGSMTVFQADVVDQMSLETEGYGPRFEDRTAGALDVRTRDGSGSQRSVRVTAGAADAGALAEGPLGRRGSWLAGVRKSYLQYLVKQSGDEPTLAFGFVDSQAQATWGLGAGSTLRVKLVDGTSDFDRSEWRDRLALNTSMRNAYRFTVANVGWEWAPGGGFVMSTHGAYLRERYDDTNRDTRALSEGFYGEWVAKTDVAWSWARPATLAFGAEARRVRADGFSDYYFDAAAAHAGGRVSRDGAAGGRVRATVVERVGEAGQLVRRGAVGRAAGRGRDGGVAAGVDGGAAVAVDAAAGELGAVRAVPGDRGVGVGLRQSAAASGAGDARGGGARAAAGRDDAAAGDGVPAQRSRPAVPAVAGGAAGGRSDRAGPVRRADRELGRGAGRGGRVLRAAADGEPADGVGVVRAGVDAAEGRRVGGAVRRGPGSAAHGERVGRVPGAAERESRGAVDVRERVSRAGIFSAVGRRVGAGGDSERGAGGPVSADGRAADEVAGVRPVEADGVRGGGERDESLQSAVRQL